jgi:hypothetical protein
MLAVGALLLGLAILVVLPVFVIALTGNPVLGAAVWLGVYVTFGIALVIAGRLTLRLEVPPRTLASFEETKAWVLRQIRSNGR